MGRAGYLATKLWQFSLEALQRPRLLPRLLRGLWQGAHAAEYLKMLRYVPWLDQWRIRTVLDVGAHVGEFASAAWVAFPQARIYSFEPQPHAFARLRAKMGARERWQGFQLALGREPGRLPMWQSAYSAASSLLPMAEAHRQAFPWTAPRRVTEVEVQTLDALRPQLVLEPGVLLKIDVQGFELAVLEGAEATLAQVDVCLIEASFEELYHGMPGFDALYRFLTARGFAYRGAWSQFLAPQDRRILQQDALFVRVGG